MNAFNPIDFTHDLERVGFQRDQAETLARGYQSAMQAHVTQEQLKAALAKQALYLVGVLGSLTIGCTAVLALILH